MFETIGIIVGIIVGLLAIWEFFLKKKKREEKLSSVTVIHPTLPPKPYFAHSKPLEGYWVGRKSELEQLTEWYQDKAVRVIGLVGFGGEGKSALARKWIDKLQPEGIFWWCFYHEPSLDAFLEAALRYISGGQFQPNEACSAYARVHALLDYLTGGRFVLILDGLEEMQKAKEMGEHFGEMKDITFTDLLRGWAEREHHSLALITTRYPLKDLQPYKENYRHLDLEHLSPEDASELMRKRGVTGADEALDTVAGEYNYHALCLKLITGYLKECYGGNIKYAPQIPSSAVTADEKVDRILTAYDAKLKAAQREFMAIFSTFRRPVEEKAFKLVFRKQIPGFDNRVLVKLGDFEFRQMIRHLVNLGLITEDRHDPKHITNSTHPLIRDYYYEHFGK